LAISVVPKGKNIKVLTHRPRYIVRATLPKLGEGTSSIAKAEQPAPTILSTEESTVVPKVPIAKPAEAKEETTKKPELEKVIVLPEILSPLAEAELPNVTKALATTPKRRRMASVLDAVMETTRSLTPIPVKKAIEAATGLQLMLKSKLGPQYPQRQSLLQLSRGLNKNF
jgi:hypothetical protein